MEEHRQPLVTRLYNRILEYEERFDRLQFDVTTSIRSGDHNRIHWLECRHQLRSLFSELIRVDPEFIVKGGLLSNFWTKLYYSSIEQIRIGLSKGNGDVNWVLNLEGLNLIDEGLGYFMMLIYELRATCQKSTVSIFCPVKLARENGMSIAINPEVVNQIEYDCYLYCGDLFRYKNLFQPTDTLLKKGDFEIAAGFYKNASSLLPELGHAYNQLAVICCFDDDVLSAIAYYLKSLMAMRPFKKSAENLLIVSRKVVNIPEERLFLSDDPPKAALFGLLLRLICAVIIQESSRSSQSVHLDSINSSLRRFLTLPKISIFNDVSNSNDEEVLLILFCSLILDIEYIQLRPSNNIGGIPFLSPSQMALLEWMFSVSERILGIVFNSKDENLSKIFGIKALSLFNLWMITSNIFDRIDRTLDDASETFQKSLISYLRLFADSHDKIPLPSDHHQPLLEMLPEDKYLSGSRVFVESFFANDLPSDLSKARMSRIWRLFETLTSRENPFIVFDSNGKRYYYRGDFESMMKREQTMSKLARQRLVEQVSTLSATIESPVPQQASPWYLIEAESLMKYWSLIEPLLIKSQIRVIITLAALRFLDYAKNDNEKRTKARQIMRFLASKSNSPSVRLQNPSESSSFDDRAIHEGSSLQKHHKALISAAIFYSTEKKDGLTPLIIITEDLKLSSAVKALDLDDDIVSIIDRDIESVFINQSQ